MAGNGDTKNDLGAHEQSYEGFIGWLKIGMIASALAVALVVFLITR